MTTYINTNNSDIIRAENIKYLDIRIKQIRTMLEDEEDIEKAIIELLITALCEHGKDENQIRQISQISKILGEALGLDIQYCTCLGQAALIYDIGNIAISSEIYKKDNTLSFEEFSIVKNHTLMGYEILIAQGFASTKMGALISAEHHEWWNGGGYPRQLKEIEISILSRIVAVADTVGALYRVRPGRKAWEFNKIINYIQERDGLQFSPEVVKAFLDKQESIYEVLSS